MVASRPYDLVIVGMGSAGVVAAEFAASLPIRVAAVERDRVGGDCLWTGCVPSKALLAAAHVAHVIRTADRFGIAATEPEVDTGRVFEHIRKVQERIGATDDSPDRFRDLGVDVRVGEAARLDGPHRLRVGEEVLDAKRVLLCPGSKPAIPPVDGLEAVGSLTSESVWGIERAPASLLLLGGGPIAVEMAQGFRRLGVEVTILELADRLLAREEPELADRLTARLRAEGVGVELGATIERASRAPDGAKTLHAGARSWSAEEIVIATGRVPQTEDLGLEHVGLAPGPNGVLAVDGRARTQLDWLYAVGDVTGGYQFTHVAAADAAAAVRDMFFPGRGHSATLVPWATFTDPELARVGMTSVEARERHGADDVEVHTIGLDRSDRARAEHDDDGLLVAVTHRDELVGAHVLAPRAGEMIGELTLAISQGMKLSELASVVHVYPTYATSIAQLASESAFARAGRYHWLVRA